MRPPSLPASHPVFRTATFLAEVRGSRMVDLVSGRPGVQTSVTGMVATAYGSGVRFVNTGSAQAIEFAGVHHRLSGQGPFTLAVFAAWDGDTTAYQTPISIEDDIGLYAPRNSAGSLQVDSTSMSTVAFGSEVIASDDFEVLAYGISASSTTADLYRDGVFAVVSDSSFAYPDYGGAGSVWIGRGQGSELYHGTVVRAALWARELSAAEHVSAARLLRGGVVATPVILRAPAPAGGGTTIPAVDEGMLVGGFQTLGGGFD